jgi:hypothetical protein
MPNPGPIAAGLSPLAWRRFAAPPIPKIAFAREQSHAACMLSDEHAHETPFQRFLTSNGFRTGRRLVLVIVFALIGVFAYVNLRQQRQPGVNSEHVLPAVEAGTIQTP